MSILPGSGLFVDTAGWAGIALRNGSGYQAMEAFYRRAIATRRNLVTTNYVLSELVALLTARSRAPRRQVIAFITGIRHMPQLTLVHVDVATDADAWALLEQQDDKDWSLVDAASFVVMHQLGLQEAFTSDHHFVQAGFVRVPS
ncbi:MAG TPA: PIN domain-containing protein [Chloroflexota bacterium]|jgi:predicted nucleic acid-binding protein|nr:PIN domain-containing protein [Chloroflexota bacterium]